MIYIFEGGGIVFDGDTLTAKEKKEAVFTVKTLPIEPEKVEGKITVLQIDYKGKKLFYDHMDEPVIEGPDPQPMTLEQLQKIVLQQQETLSGLVKNDELMRGSKDAR